MAPIALRKTMHLVENDMLFVGQTDQQCSKDSKTRPSEVQQKGSHGDSEPYKQRLQAFIVAR